MKWRFALRFLAAFALCVILWSVTNFPQLYRTAILATARLVSPAVNGWLLDYDQPGMVDPIVFRSANMQLPMLLQIPLLSMSLMPFLALVVATPGLGIKRAASIALRGTVLYFLIHLAVVLAYPAIMNRPNVLKDTLGVFSGLVAFVVAPLGLWFVLTYPVLRSVWRLSPR